MVKKSRKGWNELSSPALYSREHNRLTKERFATCAEQLLLLPVSEVRTIAEYADQSTIVAIVAGAVLIAKEHGNYMLLDKLLDRVIGKVTQGIQVIPTGEPDPTGGLSFAQFCERAGYPAPYDPQVDMMEFGMHRTAPRLLLGARGYGKTDYVVILGIAYAIYLDPTITFLIVTKSRERNTSILNEIYKACTVNGVEFEIKNSSTLRVNGLSGKDHSVSAITIGAGSIRGRHPKKIVMDDPVTEEDVSEATRKRVQAKYNELTKLTSDILIIGQPVHKFDLYETLRPLIDKMELPHGSIPELDHDIEAQRLAGVSEESIQASYFLKVMSETGFPLERVKLVPDFIKGQCVAFIDPSYEGGDYTALSIVRAHFEGVLVKGRVWKRAWYDCLDEMCKEMLECGVLRVCFETNCLGEQPVTMLRDLLPDGIGVVGKKSMGPKHARIVAAGAFAPMIHVAQTSDKNYIQQVTRYEYGVEPDDAPDSLASALEWIGLIRGRS